jgi:flagellum-specific peptidoglycan hydrolase FlgJ
MNLDTQIYNLAIQNGFSDAAARLLVAQAHLESSDINGKSYNSRVYRLNKNMFGMKFIGQKNATKGTIAPFSERSAQCKIDISKCVNRDFYAKYNTPLDSAADLIKRYMNITRAGITPTMLKSSKNAAEYANLLKTRGYFGTTADHYTKMLNSKLRQIKIITGTGILLPILPLSFFF